MINPLFGKFFPPEVKTFFSDRSIDFTLHDGKPSFNKLQEKYLSEEAGISTDDIINIRQVHGDNVLVVSQKFKTIPEADAVITKMPHVTLSIRTADCLPVFICDPKKKCIGLVHAGWRGSQKRIVARAVNLMQETWGSDPEDLKVAFGPGIRECCYQVGQEFKEVFSCGFATRGKSITLDLALVNRDQLISSGVMFKNIFDSGQCTCCHDQYFSYRREGDRTGRHISLMMI
jgi:YfiH family protein